MYDGGAERVESRFATHYASVTLQFVLEYLRGGWGWGGFGCGYGCGSYTNINLHIVFQSNINHQAQQAKESIYGHPLGGSAEVGRDDTEADTDDPSRVWSSSSDCCCSSGVIALIKSWVWNSSPFQVVLPWWYAGGIFKFNSEGNPKKSNVKHKFS